VDIASEVGIYAIDNLQSHAVYVGATKTSFLERWRSHRTVLDLGHHPVVALQYDWYRSEAGWFKLVPLEIVTRTEAFAPREQYWIDRLMLEGFGCSNQRKHRNSRSASVSLRSVAGPNRLL
jgi:hypothetical protein